MHEHDLVGRLRHWSAARPHDPAIVFYGRVVTYAEYDELSDRLAGWLISLGVTRGDTVGIHLHNCPQFHIAALGISKVGAVHVPIDPLLGEVELTDRLNDRAVTVLLTQNTLSRLVKKVRPQTGLRHVARTAVSDMLIAVPMVELPFEVDDPRISDWQTIVTSDPIAPVRATSAEAPAEAAAAVALMSPPICTAAGAEFGMEDPLVSGGSIVLLTVWDVDQVLDAIERLEVTRLLATADDYAELRDASDSGGCDLSAVSDMITTPSVAPGADRVAPRR